jgi:dTDP-4-dehydrorhamnose 3,5-epimerase-like enzyme
MHNTRILDFKSIVNKTGSLVALEANKDIPFSIKRVYYIFDVPSEVRRGFHSHKKLDQVLICLSGSIKILVKDDTEEETHLLDSPSKALYIGPMIWREMFDFSEGAVLLVLASEFYTEEDYIRNWDDYYPMAVDYFRKK